MMGGGDDDGGADVFHSPQDNVASIAKASPRVKGSVVINSCYTDPPLWSDKFPHGHGSASENVCSCCIRTRPQTSLVRAGESLAEAHDTHTRTLLCKMTDRDER